MNKKKGVVLLSVIVLMSIVINVALLISMLMFSTSAFSLYEQRALEKIITTYKMQEDFIDNATIDESYDKEVEIYGDLNIKALVARVFDADYLELYFLLIYDFNTDEIILRQTSNFYITQKTVGYKDYYYLGDLVKYKEMAI